MAEPATSLSQRRPNGHFLPESWEPHDRLIEQCKAIGLTEQSVEWEAAKFRDYWMAATRNAKKRDWDAAFRMWCRKAVEFRKHNRTVSTDLGEMTDGDY